MSLSRNLARQSRRVRYASSSIRAQSSSSEVTLGKTQEWALIQRREVTWAGGDAPRGQKRGPTTGKRRRREPTNKKRRGEHHEVERQQDEPRAPKRGHHEAESKATRMKRLAEGQTTWHWLQCHPRRTSVRLPVTYHNLVTCRSRGDGRPVWVRWDPSRDSRRTNWTLCLRDARCHPNTIRSISPLGHGRNSGQHFV